MRSRRFLKRCAGAALVASLALVLSGTAMGHTTTVQSGALQVHVIDVGQGDSTLIVTPDGAAALIDGGDANGMALEYLQSLGIRRLNLMIATHPHADHIGGLVQVLGGILVEKVIVSGSSHAAFEGFLDTVDAAGVTYIEALRGDRFSLSGLTLDVLSPSPILTGDANEDSLVLRLVCSNTRLLFMGDAGAQAEASMLDASLDVAADFIKVGHHGSCDGSTVPFLQAVSPEVAVISVGRGNGFGHPCFDTLTRLTSAEAEIRRTDLEGTIVIEAACSPALEPNQPPVAAFVVAPPKPDVGQAVTFSASTSRDSDGTIESYTWSFGDGTTATGQQVTHSYSSAGTYAVILTVTDDDAAVASSAQTVSVARPLRHVVINELEMNPLGDDKDNEWVELYNASSEPANLSGWCLTYTNNNGGMVQIASVVLQPGEYLVYFYSGQRLNNTSGAPIQLIDPQRNVIDATPRGLTDDKNTASTWQRVPNGYDTDQSSDWSFRLGTKGALNG